MLKILYMAHYARVNSNNVVTYVTTIPNEMITDENGVEHEERAISHLQSSIPDSVNDTWKQTSRSGSFRKHFAGIGFTWDETRNAFIPPKPYPSWTFVEESCTWTAPQPYPTEVEGGPKYTWNEEIGNWKPIYNFNN